MRKRTITILLVITILVGLGAVYMLTEGKRPPVETKFAQVERQRISTESGEVSGDERETQGASAGVKEPGNYALLDNPTHVYQTFNNCGPATLTMVLNRLGENVTQKQLGDKMRPYQVASGDNDDKTIFTYEFVDWAEKYGYQAVARRNGDIELLKKFTANGIPVVVKTWLNIDEDIGHFRIVRGFDEQKQVILQDDSYQGKDKEIPYYDFLSMWQPFNYDYMIVYTPDQERVVRKIIGEEMDEKAAWQNALERARKEAGLDSENPYPYFNMSTAYYHLGEYQKSVENYERVENDLPRRMLWYQIEPIQAYRQLGNYDRVFRIISNILENGNRAYSELYQMRGEIYLEQGRVEEAKREFEKAIEYNKNYQPAKDALKEIS